VHLCTLYTRITQMCGNNPDFRGEGYAAGLGWVWVIGRNGAVECDYNNYYNNNKN